MSDTAGTSQTSPPTNDRCVTCLCSFGVQIERIPRTCTNVKCGRQFCTRCVNQIQVNNGNDRPFQCMFCLQVYPLNSLPLENQLLIKQLWDTVRTQYHIKHTQRLLLNECDCTELTDDIDCRRRHLMNLVSLYKRFCGRTLLLGTTEHLLLELNGLFRYMNENTHGNVHECKTIYRRLISDAFVDDSDIGMVYIGLCERVQWEISEAEYCSVFPNVNTKSNTWSCEQGTGQEFQPKVLELLQAMEQDLIDQWKNPYLAARTKIGLIGYVGAGKSSLVNRLLGMKSLAEEGAAPVSMTKGTYFPLQFDRSEPLVSPEDPKRKTLVTLVDIPGVDKDDYLTTVEGQEDNYLEAIRRAGCDVYILVHDGEFSDKQQGWIDYIEEGLKRKCVVVRSKVDIYYLAQLQYYSSTSQATLERSDAQLSIIEQLRLESTMASRDVFLIACGYPSKSNDSRSLLKNESLDFPLLLETLGRLAFDACSSRIHAMAHRTIARAINTSFRRGYVLNVLKYKIAAGFASILPFGDQLPRYLSRDSIRQAFGVDDALRQYLAPFHLVICNYKLQTSIFAECVEVKSAQNNSKVDTKWVGRTAGAALVVGGGFTEDILRLATPAATALSGAARAIFTVATVGIGVAISAGVSAWSAVDSGKHIFSYINRICDDIIMITDPLITSIIEREREKVRGTGQ